VNKLKYPLNFNVKKITWKINMRLLAILTIFLSTLFTLIVVELGVQIFVTHILKHGKLFQSDPNFGWSVLPNLDLERSNANGEPWVIRTSKNGVRGSNVWKLNRVKRVLIIGDSFAFGEGVNVEKRFDSILNTYFPRWSFINLGVMGYGTDQELMTARSYMNGLGKDDILFILTYYNDFLDIQRKSFAGRTKPWFELKKDKALLEHPPIIGFKEYFRDKSYILARVFQALEPPKKAYIRNEWIRGVSLYKALITSEIKVFLSNKVSVVIAFHGMGNVSSEIEKNIKIMFTSTCQPTLVHCLNLDNELNKHSKIFLKDKHWNNLGHQIVADKIIDFFKRIEDHQH